MSAFSSNEDLRDAESQRPASAEPRSDMLWAFTPMDHGPVHLGTLEEAIDQNDIVRLFAEMFGQCDWTAWEAKYAGKRGRPPIRPSILACVMLYGIYRGIRSSRKLEEACQYRLDFRWLAKGLRPDHCTFSEFRRRFKEPLKDLFRQINRMAMTLGLISLGQIAYDGTRVKAYNSRYKTYTKEKIESKLQGLDQQFEEAMRKFEQDDPSSDGGGSVTKLPEHLASIDERRTKLLEAKKRIEQLEQERRASGLKTTAQLPINDFDSRVMPNKEGGYAPNYTPTATTDGASGFIVDCDVLNTVNEGNALVASVDTIRNDYGQPETVLTDSGNNSGENLQAMADRQIAIYAPVKSTEPSAESPVQRADLHQPVAQSEYSRLPRNTHGKLDKSCFVYVSKEDRYYCPQGKPLEYKQIKREGSLETTVYQCQQCEGCPLREHCLEEKNQTGRTIRRDQYEEIRNTTAKRMSTPEAKAQYNQRPMIAETPFAILKNLMGIRQFLLRGLDNVKTEWRWCTTAFNAAKLARFLGTLRADQTKIAVTR